jgi:nicotinamide riboside transporter PnuC
MSTLPIFTWFLTVLAIIGVILNIQKRRVCFFIWAFTNASWAIVDFIMGIPAQGALFTVYFVLALWGIWAWRQ